jgi:hypothetical protein
MDLKAVVSVLMTERKPQEDAQLTALSGAMRERGAALVKDDPALGAFMLCSWAGRFRSSEVHVDCKDRRLNLRLQDGKFPADLFSSEEMLGWWWLLISGPCKAWLAVSQGGQVETLGWDGSKVYRNSGPAPESVSALEFQASLPELESPVFSAMADKKLIDQVKTVFLERARVFPIPIYFDGVLWEWPLDIRLERMCSFTSYDLVAEGGELGFAVGHPWAHGCRYWLKSDGNLLDLVSRGATETEKASGNICHMPALGDDFVVSRRLNILRKRDEPCIELSPAWGIWGKHSFSPGYERYQLSRRTVFFGQNPVIRMQMRPLRARLLLMQTDQLHEAGVIVPVKDGMILDSIFVPSKPGGLHALAVVPPELATTRQSRQIADKEAGQAWARSIVAKAQELQKPLLE